MSASTRNTSRLDLELMPVPIPQHLWRSLRCPRCHGRLTPRRETLCCAAREGCSSRFPVVGGVPVLIDERRSLFRIEDVVAASNHAHATPRNGWNSHLTRRLPELTRNLKARRNYALLRELLHRHPGRPRVLVLGCGRGGSDTHLLLADEAFDLLETDICLGPRASLVCDAQAIPFADETFDAVIAQAVLDDLPDTGRAAREIHRVLARGGLVYAETPFLQPVHDGPYDFSRFTHLGHRRLFRSFNEIASGAVGGPGMALAWSFESFLLAWGRSNRSRAVLRLLSRATVSWLKYCDYYLADRPGGLDAACGCYFLGRKSSRPLLDRELIALYRGHGAARR